MTEKIAFELRQDEKLAGCIAVKIYPILKPHPGKPPLTILSATTNSFPLPLTFFTNYTVKEKLSGCSV